MIAKFRKAVRKLYAVGILVYFAAAGVLALSIPDFSEWVSFMSRHALYAVIWPVTAAAEVNALRGLIGPQR